MKTYLVKDLENAFDAGIEAGLKIAGDTTIPVITEFKDYLTQLEALGSILPQDNTKVPLDGRKELLPPLKCEIEASKGIYIDSSKPASVEQGGHYGC